MSERTAIEWTDGTWNPVTGCTKVDGDCKFCYMYRDRERYGQDPTKVTRTSKSTFDSILNPAKYKPGSLVFTASWSDWWHPDTDVHRADMFANVDKRRDLTFQILTKRPERVAGTLPATWGDGWPHVWLGTSVGSPKGADRARYLADLPAVVRFLSIEPLWAPGVADAIRPVVESGRIDWIILGGESGPKARPMHPGWAREIRDLALANSVPLIFKQWGEWAPTFDYAANPDRDPVVGEFHESPHEWIVGCMCGAGTQRMYRVGKKSAGRDLDGVIHDAYPTPRRVSP